MDFYKALEDLISLFQFTSETVPIDTSNTKRLLASKSQKHFFLRFVEF